METKVEKVHVQLQIVPPVVLNINVQQAITVPVEIVCLIIVVPLLFLVEDNVYQDVVPVITVAAVPVRKVLVVVAVEVAVDVVPAHVLWPVT